MISHKTLGSNDIQKAESFYTAILACCGASLIYKSEIVIFYEFLDSPTKLSITKPLNGLAASVR
ncbi:hypothetical protein GCM10009092_10120 [Bowmanella denitrificans]|uniref:Glyoxalase/fosfomycin resistance/dioxygenase domain-containing protein n=1 Tax=Bowmanella denitrificans TaxID=366582 RepID=A0ABP3GM46_9ALTE